MKFQRFGNVLGNILKIQMYVLITGNAWIVISANVILVTLEMNAKCWNALRGMLQSALAMATAQINPMCATVHLGLLVSIVLL
jgi:hypothetical protein